MDIKKKSRPPMKPERVADEFSLPTGTTVTPPILKQITKPSNKNAYLLSVATIILGIILLLLGLRFVYTGRIYHGVWGNGVYIGGLTKQQAIAVLDKKTSHYLKNNTITIKSNGSSWKINSADINTGYDNARLVDDSYRLGRTGSLYRRFVDEAVLFLGLYPRDNYAVDFDPQKLDHYTINIAENINSPVRNASYSFTDSVITIEPEQPGARLDLANLNQALIEHYGSQSNEVITITPKEINPLVTATDLEVGKQKINTYAKQDISLNYGESSWQIDRQQILDWIRVVAISSDVFTTNQLDNYYQLNDKVISYEPDPKSINIYLDNIAKKINRDAQDAKLTITDGRATVFARSADGRKLNLSASTESIIKAITQEGNKSITLTVDVKKAAVSDDNIEALGIRELLSDGYTLFPGSSADRNTNIRIGASRYNGVLLKPGQQFSFGDYLGPIGPEQGYKQSKVILEGRLENEYGGGLCQVSTTAFRAALLAGLPITERYNHAFAVSYYTAPYGVPGVDATIYYPGVDFKFRNDTDAHILIQTEMSGTTLHFRFYGTKKKEGVIRGPSFVSGSSDPNQPSRTVFYRDVVVNGAVTKTDSFYTNYKSAKDFPPVN